MSQTFYRTLHRTLHRTPCHTLWLALLLALGSLPATAAAAPEARVYQVANRPANDLAAQIRDLYPDGQVTISARGQQLVIRGEPELLDEIGLLVDTMDVAPAQLRITVRSRTREQNDSSGGSVTIYRSSPDGYRNNAGVRVEQQSGQRQRSQERHLVMLDGQSAHITSGQVRTIPVAVRGGRNPAAILDQIETRSGFLVTPQVISGQMVELTIMAFEEDPADAIAGYDTEAVMTIRRVRAGEWVELGSSTVDESGQRSGLIYRRDSQRTSSQSFELRVEVL